MKKNLIISLAILIMPCALMTSCSSDDPAPDLFISVDPLVTEISLPGETVEYNISVAGDLQSVNLNNEVIKTYDQGTFEDSFIHVFTWPEDADSDMQLTFSVIERGGAVKEAITQISYIMPDYTLADFSQKIADEAKWGDWWEGEAINTVPGATYNGGNASPSMYVTCRGGYADSNWDFEANLPGGGTGLMMTRLSIREEGGGTAWSGYMMPVFGWYGDGMNQPSSLQLDMAKAGQRVIAIDLYYQTDASSPKSFEDLSVDGKGVKVQFRLGNLAKYKESADKKGWFMAKEAFVSQADEWVTLYFDQDDEVEIAGLTMDGSSNEVDFAWFIPAFGNDHWDSHKIFLRNFRITNPE
jgi:hypothetical protein